MKGNQNARNSYKDASRTEPPRLTKVAITLGICCIGVGVVQAVMSWMFLPEQLNACLFLSGIHLLLCVISIIFAIGALLETLIARRTVSSGVSHQWLRRAWMGLGLTVFSLLVLNFLNMAMVGRIKIRPAAHALSCMSNLKQIGLALLMYIEDYNERFPAPGANWEEVLYPYCKNSDIFLCPSDRNGLPSYQLNPSLRGVVLGQILEPARTVAVFESDDLKTVTWRHQNGAHFCFVDGHVKWFSAGTEKELNWD